jgi:SAM-dependent methyltransferase
MGKQGEIDYLKQIGPGRARRAADKPFAEPDCSDHFLDFGALLTLLPPPPAPLLDLGCGTGWTSCFLARRGYAVVGQDLAPDMIDLAWRNKERYCPDADLHFLVSDYEDLDYEEEFDAAVFYHSLHHAVDEAAALRGVCRALRPGGVCVASEPGRGHSNQPDSVEAVRRYGVTEKDMPPRTVLRLARAAGFRGGRVYPRPSDLLPLIHRPPGRRFGLGLRRLAWLLFPEWMATPSGGLVALTK